MPCELAPEGSFLLLLARGEVASGFGILELGCTRLCRGR